MKDEEFSLVPKQFINSVTVGSQKNAVHTVFLSGNAAIGITMTPEQFKLSLKAYEMQLKKYEEAWGEIDISKAAIPVPSMYTAADFSKPGDEPTIEL